MIKDTPWNKMPERMIHVKVRAAEIDKLTPDKAPKKETKRKSRRKYQKGPTFRYWIDLSAWLDSGNWIYLNGKVMHPSFLMSMPYRVVMNYFMGKQLAMALLVDMPEERTELCQNPLKK